MKRPPRSGLILLAIALTAITLLTLLLAPSGNRQQYGSTYSRAPTGYGAWYAQAQTQAIPLARWRQPFNELPESEDEPPQTFLRVYSNWEDVFEGELEWDGEDFDNEFTNISREAAWVEAGNNLVLIGVRGLVTGADFRQALTSPLGQVQIETRRRQPQAKDILLGDRFGAIVWQQTRGAGRIIYAATPYLAANAYQDSPANYKFLTQLVSQQADGTPVSRIWIDEYLHGYRERETLAAEGRASFWGYMAQTPIAPAFLQALVILAIALWALNRRFGQPAVVPEPAVNNSQAYIEALASVLQKAESSDFVLATLGKAEQEQLQRALGLGRGLVEPEVVLAAWQQQTGRSPESLQHLLANPEPARRPNETELLAWLRRWRTLPAPRRD
ncbi:MAG: DUF4350 domain-containing protein [Spirulinaceae cyanobacterium SM2_1_0]|nr:DUF4350 domain-containing protein [Spirulinaceae cyanobacterium SM2_1_0]